MMQFVGTEVLKTVLHRLSIRGPRFELGEPT